jgi:hypothetical protein
MKLRTRLLIIWHTRPFHSRGLITTRHGVYCERDGANIARFEKT